MTGRKRTVKSLFLCFFSFFLLLIMGCGIISDGEYAASVTLTGGSGRAYIESPCTVRVENGKATAEIVWSSENYDYMVVDGKIYYPEATAGGSRFIIPITPEKNMNIQADTVAMSEPHLIDYVVRFSLNDGGKTEEETEENISGMSMDPPEIPGIEYVSTDENDEAENFRIHRYKDGYAVLCIDDGRKYLMVPYDKDIPENTGKDISVVMTPSERIYMAGSGSMCHFDAIGAMDNISLSGIKKEDWYIESAVRKMEDGSIGYGGKYSAPDYEEMLKRDIDLAIENTMILHSPRIIEKIEDIGIPVLIDRSSHEPSVSGRMEWVKVYGLITGKEEEAREAYETQKALIDSISTDGDHKKTVAVFALNGNHLITTRRENDYFSKMIEMAGGEYLAPVEEDEEAGGTSTMSISTEAFYDMAKDADILIYNGIIEEIPESVEALSGMDTIFPELKAVKEGNVWYMDESVFQFAGESGTIIEDLYRVFSEGAEETGFFHKLY